jgi:uncharacterized protein
MAQDISFLSGMVSRRLLGLTTELMKDEPVIALQGPRTVGKSTLLTQLASAHRVEVIDLDEPATRTAATADPTAFVDGPSPVCIDEFQHVPAILEAVKAQLNRELRPGRFVITGSTRYDALPTAARSLTGRLHLLTVWPFTQGEIAGVRENLLATLLEDPLAAIPHGTVSSLQREDYIVRVTRGGMPLALARRSTASRNRWFDDYVELVLERDVRELSRLRQREQLPQLLKRLAAQTAGVLNITKAATEAGLDRTTTTDYLKLLEAVFLIVRLPAWGKTVRARASSAPKLHVVDAGLAARLLRLTPERLSRRDPSALTDFGHLLETFVVGELMRQASWLDGVASYGHWRTYDDDEVDLVIEREDGGVLAFEVKSAGQVALSDTRHLRKLRDALGERFLGGVALYTGTRAYRLEDRIRAMPIDRIWTPL